MGIVSHSRSLMIANSSLISSSETTSSSHINEVLQMSADRSMLGLTVSVPVMSSLELRPSLQIDI